MKRDLELIRDLLTELEQTDRLIERTDGLGAHQIAVIIDRGLAVGHCSRNGRGLIFRGILQRLTWEGHEFLDAMRDDTVWQRVKKNVLTSACSWTFDLLMEYAEAQIKPKLGI